MSLSLKIPVCTRFVRDFSGSYEATRPTTHDLKRITIQYGARRAAATIPTTVDTIIYLVPGRTRIFHQSQIPNLKKNDQSEKCGHEMPYLLVLLVLLVAIPDTNIRTTTSHQE